MAEQELTTEQALQLLQGRSAAPQVATPIEMPLESVAMPSSSLLSVDTPYKKSLGVGAGGLLNLADALTFGMTGNLAAGGSAIYGDIESFFTGQPSTTSFELERQKLAELKNLARAEQVAQGSVGIIPLTIPESVPLIGGAPTVEVAGALKAPIPKAAIIGKGEKLAPALMRAVPAATAMGALPGASVEVPLDEIADAATTGAVLSGALTALAPTLGRGISAAAPKAEETGKALMRKALGARISDYTKTAKNRIIENVEGDFETQVKKSLNNLIEDDTLGKSLDADTMYSRLQDAKEGVETQIQAALAKYDKKVPVPSFDKTLSYISQRISADDVDSYLNQLERYSDAIKREGKGSLSYLNTQKKIVGENWKNSPQSDPGFWRTLYRELKEHIEKYAPEVKDLNKKKQDLIVAEPIIERSLRAAEGGTDINNIMKLLYTTGGAGLAGGAILGGVAGEPGAGVAGALGLRALATPKGQQLAGRALRRLSTALSGMDRTQQALELAPMTVMRGGALVPALSGYQTPISGQQELSTEEALSLIK